MADISINGLQRCEAVKHTTPTPSSENDSERPFGFMVRRGEGCHGMATTGDSPTGRTERCEVGGRETTHRVTIQIKTENAKADNAAFSREPYRVSECQVCGHRESRRMNGV